MMLTITAPEMRGATESRRANFTTTSKGIIIGGSWLKKPTPWDAQAISGPHRKTWMQRVKAAMRGRA